MNRYMNGLAIGAAMIAFAALPAAAQSSAPNAAADTGSGEVYQAAVACSAAYRYEARATGEAEYTRKGDELAGMAVETGVGLGLSAEDVQAQLTDFNEEYANAVGEEEGQHARMIEKCDLLAGATSGEADTSAQ